MLNMITIVRNEDENIHLNKVNSFQSFSTAFA